MRKASYSYSFRATELHTADEVTTVVGLHTGIQTLSNFDDLDLNYPQEDFGIHKQY